MNTTESVLDQTVEQLERMNTALIALRRELLPLQPRTFAILAGGAAGGKPAYHAKARFRAWMASQSDFDLRLGKAAEKGLVAWANPAFDGLREFLKRLAVDAQNA